MNQPYKSRGSLCPGLGSESWGTLSTSVRTGLFTQTEANMCRYPLPHTLGVVAYLNLSEE